MNEGGIPSRLDWVEKRTRCSLRALFADLSSTVKSDIESALRHQSSLRSAPLKLTADAFEHRLVVTAIWDLGNGAEEEAVVFRCVDNEDVIDVEYLTERNGKVPQRMFTATRRLSEDGRCVLAVGGQALELWQISRMALEEFLFGYIA